MQKTRPHYPPAVLRQPQVLVRAQARQNPFQSGLLPFLSGLFIVTLILSVASLFGTF
jgi:hypothetical protein